VNNYIHNPKMQAIHYVLSPAEWEGKEWVTGIMGIEGNLIEYGPDTRASMPAVFFKGPVKMYWEDNKIISVPGTPLFQGDFERLSLRPFWPRGLKVMSSDEVRDYVLENAGAFPWQRDEIDQKVIEGVRGKTLRIINSEREAGGYPQYKPVYSKFNEIDWDLGTMTRKNRIKN
jgi:hypothetical protein